MAEKTEVEQSENLDVNSISELIAKQVRVALEEHRKDESVDKAKTPAFVKALGETGPAPKRYELKDGEAGIASARILRALAWADGDVTKAQYFCKKAAWDDQPGDRVSKALAAGDFDSGGFMVPEDMVMEIIDLLRPASIVRRAGPTMVPMPRGTLQMPKQLTDVSSAYVGENQTISKSEPTGGQIVLSAKKLACLVPVSNELLSFSLGSMADDFIRQTMVRQMATKEDQTFIRGVGSEWAPKGLRYHAIAANITASNGTTATQIESDFRELIDDLEGANVDMRRPVWFMNPRTKNFLMTLRDANGNLIYPEVRSPTPTVHGYPIFVSTNVPKNLGGGTDSEIYFVNMTDILLGEVGRMEMAVDRAASYSVDGTLVSAFANDQTVVRLITQHDLKAVHDEAIAVKTGVAY